MKTIVCYGDSNTWGYDPATSTRFAPDVRWTGVMAAELGAGYRVVEEGLSGRTTVWEDPIEEHRNGKTYLMPCMMSHKPIDLVILMLGTNDLKTRFNVSASDIASGAALLAEKILASDTGIDGAAPQVLLAAPPPVGTLDSTRLEPLFAGSEEKSQQFDHWYRLKAEELGIPYFNAGDHVTCSPLDAIHYEAAEHHRLGLAMAQKVREIMA